MKRLFTRTMAQPLGPNAVIIGAMDDQQTQQNEEAQPDHCGADQTSTNDTEQTRSDEGFERATQATSTRMYKYAAFISYQHNERDARVAQEVQRSIESFRFPKGMGGGNKGLGKCFRDEDELAVSSSLPKSIKQALGESAALIVVCSPEAKRSAWVEREIKEYVSMHGAGRVFAVLADGEPQTAYPQALLGANSAQALTGADSDGADAFDEDTAPFAADFRYASRKKRPAERTRLMAALADVDYDNLVQRLERRRKKTRVASLALVVLIASLGLLSLFEAGNRAIAESKELAMRSQMELESGHRIQALKTALSALPSSGACRERPLVDEAERALDQALQIYCTDSAWLPTFCLEMPDRVVSFTTSPSDGCWAALIDEQMNLGIFDLQTGALLHLFKLEEDFAELKTFPPNRELSSPDADRNVPSSSVDAWVVKPYDKRHVLVYNREEPGGMACVEVLTGERVWQFRGFRADGVCVSPDGKTVGVVSVDPEKKIILSLIDVGSVSIKGSSDYDMTDENEGHLMPDGPLPCAVDNDGNMRFAIGYDSYAYTVEDDSLHHRWKSSWTTSVEPASGLESFDGKIAVLDGQGKFFATEVIYAMAEGNRGYEGEWRANLTDGQSLLWSNSGAFANESILPSDDYRQTKTRRGTPCIEGTVARQGNEVIVRAGNTVMLLSSDNGEVVWSRSYGSNVLDATALYSAEGRCYLCVATSDGTLDMVWMSATSMLMATSMGRIPFDSSKITVADFASSYTLALAMPFAASNEVLVYRFWTREKDDVAPGFTFSEKLDTARRIVSANAGSGEDAGLVQKPWFGNERYVQKRED